MHFENYANFHAGPRAGSGSGRGKICGPGPGPGLGNKNQRAGPGSGSRGWKMVGPVPGPGLGDGKWRGSGSEVRARLDPQINSLLLDLFIGRKIV